MADTSTKKMLRFYKEKAATTRFLSSMAQTPPENFHDTESVEIDIQRSDEDVAVVVHDVSAGARENKASEYTSKEFIPPVFKEKGVINGFDMDKRQPGEIPYGDPNFVRNALRRSLSIFELCSDKITRAIEQMASQVFQTGVISLTDKTGVVLYTLDFQMKATHLVTPTAWNDAGTAGEPLTDVGDLATVIKRDGKRPVTKAIFGRAALRKFLANADVKARLDNRRLELGLIKPRDENDATYYGDIWIDGHRIELWMYDGYFRAPGDGAYTDYIGTNNVVLVAGSARYDLSYGSIPRILPPDPRVGAFLPGRIASVSGGYAMNGNAWVSPDGSAVHIEIGTRPLFIPTEIDTFGCLTVS